ncbi:MAG: 50S ribosomal protein L14 [bacterium]|nr:50S ribosomal protein L14 [bacterium]
MIQERTILTAADNTGVSKMMVIHLFGGNKKKPSRIGNLVKCVVKVADPLGTVKTKEMVLAVICRTRKELGRPDGSYVRFSDNAGVIIDTAADKNPRGTRVFGPIARELKELGFAKIISMAQEVV